MSKTTVIMSTFAALYNASEAALKEAKQPLVKKRNQRAVQAAIDSAVEQKMEAEEQLENALKVVAEGKVVNLNTVLQCRATIKNAEQTIAELTAFETEFFA